MIEQIMINMRKVSNKIIYILFLESWLNRITDKKIRDDEKADKPRMYGACATLPMSTKYVSINQF